MGFQITLTIFARRNEMKRKEIVMPGTKLKLVKLWPHGRKRHETGERWKVGYYCRTCGLDTIWLVDKKGKYSWTIDYDFLNKHFEIKEKSKIRNLYTPQKIAKCKLHRE